MLQRTLSLFGLILACTFLVAFSPDSANTLTCTCTECDGTTHDYTRPDAMSCMAMSVVSICKFDGSDTYLACAVTAR